MRRWLVVPIASWIALAGFGCAPSAPGKSAPQSASASPEKEGLSEAPDAVATTPAAKRECATFIDTINEMLIEIQRVSARRADDERETRRDLEELRELYETLHGRLDRMKLETSELSGFGKEYLAMIRKVQTSIGEVVKALDDRDVARAEKAQADFGRVIALEDDLVDRINAFCDLPAQQTA